MPFLDPRLYTVAWIAPLEIEVQAALQMLDREHSGRLPVSPGDDYVFHAGEIHGHNVIIATFAAGQLYGTNSATSLASHLRKYFPNLWFGLLVGVAAGLPNLSCSPPRDIRLGDVIVALPDGENPAIVPYGLGKQIGGVGFQLPRNGHSLPQTVSIVRSAIGKIKVKAPRDTEAFLCYYKDIAQKEAKFADPGQDKDVLYEIGNIAPVPRSRRADCERTRVWYGPIGSGDKLLRSGQERDVLRDKYNVIALEMEAAGVMNEIPVGVIRGVCDYGDERKQKDWQPYAAAMAAAFAKAVLYEIQQTPAEFGTAKFLDKDKIYQQSPSLREQTQGFYPIPSLYHMDLTSMECPNEHKPLCVPPGMISCLERWYEGYDKDLLIWGKDRAQWLHPVAHTMAHGLVRKGEVVIFIQNNQSTDLVQDFLTLFAKCLRFEGSIGHNFSKIDVLIDQTVSPVVVFFHRLQQRHGSTEAEEQFGRLLENLRNSERFRVFLSSDNYLTDPGDDAVYNIQGMLPVKTVSFSDLL